MSAMARRRIRLPADHRSPAAARAVVREVLAAAGLSDLLDEALLLTTELSTNGVIHAGTDLDIEVLVDGSGLTVTVTDYRGGPVEAATMMPPDQLAEHGRGLLLVDQFASSWGTTHDPSGKGVWFRLDRDGELTPAFGPNADGRSGGSPNATAAPPADVPAAEKPTATGPAAPADLASVPAVVVGSEVADADGTRSLPRTPRPSPTGANGTARPRGGPEIGADELVWLIHLPDDLRSRLTLSQLVSELLLRLCEVTGAAGGAVYMDGGDGRGERRLAQHGSVDEDLTGVLTVPVPLPRPLAARLDLYVSEAGPYEPLIELSAERMAIAIESERLREADVRRRGWLTFLAEASELLAQSLDVELTLALVPQIVMPRLGEWCALHVRDEYGELRLATCSHAEETALPVLKRLLGGLGTDELTERLYETLQTGSPVALPRPVEGVAVPLSARGNVLGTLSVGRPPDRLHNPDDVAVIEDIARRASLAIDNARIHAERAEVSQAFQRALLPSALPSAAGVQFAAEYEPASTGTDVGGDFYDVVELEPDRWLVAIGDVCGKGAQAAALTGLVRDVVRVLVRDGRSLEQVAHLLNRTLIEQRADGRYCTLATALVHRRGSDLEAELCLAGHDRPVLLHPDGTIDVIGACGTAVGLLDEVEVTATKLTLAPGDALVFFTDGVTERRRGTDLFGHSRLYRELSTLAGHPATVVSGRLRSAVLGFSADPPRDDIALLVVRNTG